MSSSSIHLQNMGNGRSGIPQNIDSDLPSGAVESQDTSSWDAAALYKRVNSNGTQSDPESTHTAYTSNQPLNPESTYFDAPFDDRNAILVPQYDYPAVSGNGQGDPPGSEQTPTSADLVPVVGKKDVVGNHPSNIVIFGETGVGKSSLINLIFGEKVARISNEALGCTFQHDRYIINLDGTPCAIWDTTGLEEGSEGTVPAAAAESRLKALIEDLARTGGIHLVIYCIRAGRTTKALQRNYHIFYVTVCRKKVPVALVVTNLEHQQGGMETWWNENEGELRRSGMWFDAHACVTTLDDEDEVVRSRRSESQKRLRELVLEYSRLPPWRIKRSFISWVAPVFSDALRRTFSASRPGNTKPIRKVMVCDMAEDSALPVQLSPGITTVWQKFDGFIGDRQYEFIRMDKRVLLGHAHTVTSVPQYVGGVDVGVLIFYTSPLVDTGISQRDVDALKAFYDVAGGQSCPVIVVLRGCDDEAVAQVLWSSVASTDHSGIHVHLACLPSTVDGQSHIPAGLNEMIERLCIEHVEVAPQKTSKRFFSQFSWESLRKSPDP